LENVLEKFKKFGLK